MQTSAPNRETLTQGMRAIRPWYRIVRNPLPNKRAPKFRTRVYRARRGWCTSVLVPWARKRALSLVWRRWLVAHRLWAMLGSAPARWIP